MEPMNRRGFLKGPVGTATTLTVLFQGRSPAAENKVILGITDVAGRGRALLQSLVKSAEVKIKYIRGADTRCYGPAAEIVVEGHWV